MTAWRWCEVVLPRGMSQDDVTAVVRVLTGRPRLGALQLQPPVVFELWLHPERSHWLVGMDARIADRLPGEFRAQCPGLTFVSVDDPQRPVPVAGRELRTRSLTYPVRVDMAAGVTAALLRIREDLHGSEAVVVQFVVGPGHVFSTDYPQRPTPLDLLGITVPAKPNADDRRAWRHKLDEPLFGIRGRTGAVGANRRRAAELTRPVFSALALTNDRHGRVQVSAQSGRVAAQITKVRGRARTWSSIVNAAELAALIGWSIGDLDIPGTGGRFAPAPSKLLVKSPTNTTGRILGTSLHPADGGKLVRVPVATSRHHTVTTGPTGSGKSTLLAEMARADVAAGRALFVMEPRGDLVQDILAGIGEKRRDDVVVIEPGATRSVGINPLQGPRDDAERRADQLVHLFESWFGSNIGPRSRDILLHCLIALARLPDGTIADTPILLTQPRFRREVLARVSDPLVLAPFFAWYEQLSDAERGQAISPVLNKLRVLLSPSATRRLLGQGAPRFDLTDLFVKRRIVLINLNAGVLGPDNANFIGSLVLAELWWAIQRRATIAPERRHVTMVMVDEVQNYLGSMDFGDALAQSRGLGVSWTLAHQHLDQLSPSLQASFLTNARSRVVFRPTKDARPLAEALGGGLMADDLERLQGFEAGCRLLLDSTLSKPFAVHTRPLGAAISDPEELRRASQDRYGVDGTELDKALAQRWHGAANQPDTPIGVKRRRTTP